MNSSATDDIFIRPMTAEDCRIVADWLADPEIRRFLSANLRTGSISEKHLKVGLRRPDQKWYLFTGSPSHVPVGLLALDSIDTVDGIANLWFVLGDKSRWNQGLMTRAIAALCDAPPDSIYVMTAWLIDGNDASLRCLTKAGFTMAGTYRNATLVDGVRRDRILMERQVRNA